MPRLYCLSLGLCLVVAPMGAETFETAPVRPTGGDYVPPPFTPIVVKDSSVSVRGRPSDLRGLVPRPAAVLSAAEVRLDGQPLAPPPPKWVVKTPAVAVAERSWKAGELPLTARQTVEYDGFVTLDLTVGPGSAKELAVTLTFAPEVSELYQVPRFSQTWAGRWPERMTFPNDQMAPGENVVGVWGGNETAGMAVYASTYRHWRGEGPRLVVRRDGNGPGVIELHPVSTATTWDRPTTYRLGFVATPVKEYPADHLQMYSTATGREAIDELVSRQLIWASLSDHYATFVTNDPAGDERKKAMVAEIKGKGKKALAYTTYMHVEEGAVKVPDDWPAINPADGKVIARSIGGAQAELNRVFLSPGTESWVQWKLKDLEYAIDTYGIDGLYIDTSYIIMPLWNPVQGMGWRDSAGNPVPDYPVWSMREIWRRSYELFCRKKGEACIYAHHKGGCPAALAAFTSAFCDGEQFTGQSIRNLTLDGVRAQVSGRPVGVRGALIDQYYRSSYYGARERSQWDNPTESAMLTIVNDLIATGYPGEHPNRELFALRNDLGLTTAAWTPWFGQSAWRLEGAPEVAVSSYATAAGDTVLVLANPTWEPRAGKLIGPAAAREGRAPVAIDIFSRLGRGSAATVGYRWEPTDPDRVALGRRTMAVVAFVKEPDRRERFAAQKGFVSEAKVARKNPLPPGAKLVSDFDDPDWSLANDDGTLSVTREAPVDSGAALRVEPKPQHNAAALMHSYATAEDWREFGTLSLWLRPSQPFPVRALDVKLRNAHQYGPSLKLTSHKVQDILPAGQWTKLRYAFGDVPRERVMLLRIYHHRGQLCPGPFFLDEVILLPQGAEDARTGQHQTQDDGPVPD